MSPKKKGKGAHNRYMVADFTPQDTKRIIQHCKDEKLTISNFLAQTALQDLYLSSREQPGEEELQITLKIPAEQGAKLRTFAQRQGKTVNQYVQGLVAPVLAKEKTLVNSRSKILRYYLTEQEHRLLKKHCKSKNWPPRTYVSYLALKALDRPKKK